MQTDEGTEARRWLVVRGILITVVVYIEIVLLWKIIVGRTPASSEACFGSKLTIEISLNSNTCWSCSRASFSNYCGIKYFRAVIFVVKFSGLYRFRLHRQVIVDCWLLTVSQKTENCADICWQLDSTLRPRMKRGFDIIPAWLPELIWFHLF